MTRWNRELSRSGTSCSGRRNLRLYTPDLLLDLFSSTFNQFAFRGFIIGIVVVGYNLLTMALKNEHLRVSALHNPLGIDSSNPEFSWTLASSRESVLLTAWQIQVSLDAGFGTEHIAWESGKTASDKPFAAIYEGSTLSPKTPYHWRVKTWDDRDQDGSWSETAWFETGILAGFERQAKLITRPTTPGKKPKDETETLCFRRFIDLPKPVTRGRLYTTAHGWYRSFINTTNVTADAQVPRWTPHHVFTEYQTYDVTDLFHVGENVVRAVVADGHFRGKNLYFSKHHCYGDRLGYYALLELELEGGECLCFITDDSWDAGFGRVIRSDPKDGETVNLRRPEHEWLDRKCPETPYGFKPVEVLPEPMETLIAEEVERVGIISTIKPAEMWISPSCKLLVDFGQNFTGVVRLYLNSSCESTVVLTYSEVLTKSGELNLAYINPLGADDVVRDSITTSGRGDWFETPFSLRGFRYLQIDGAPADSSIDSLQIEARFISTKLQDVSSSSCSDTRLEKLFENTLRNMYSNFQSTPMDCPTRERAGWTGDIQVFSSAAVVLEDVKNYLRRYLRCLAAE